MKNNKHTFWDILRENAYALTLGLCALGILAGGVAYYRITRPAQQTAATLPAPAVSSHKPAAQIPDETVPAIGTAPAMTQPEPQAAPASAPMRTAWPLDGDTAAVFSMDALSYNETTRDWRTHRGIDLAAQEGAQVHAAADGEVYTVYTDDVMGTTIVLRHAGGYTTTYASLTADTAVQPGDKVACGDVIGTAGTSALTETALNPHVHFEAACNGMLMNPEEFLELGQ